MLHNAPLPDMNGHVVNDDPDRPLNPGHPMTSADASVLIAKEIDGVVGEPHHRRGGKHG
jgi:hypothetical protein